jgi:phenylalanyl-tRNA synthetase alpha chain
MLNVCIYNNARVEFIFYPLGFGHCMKQKWVTQDKASGTVKRLVSSINDETRVMLQSGVTSLDPKSKEAAELSRRKLIKATKLNHYKLLKGPEFSTTRTKEHATLTKDMITNNSWKTSSFKVPRLTSMGLPTNGGYLHPLLKVRTEFRKILLSMGFSEMPTNQFVESSFWNFDSLFQPQSHPARDAHDTFFITKPATTLSVPEDYLERVKQVHESGGYESLGYNYNWKREEAMKNLLRTHTTATSSQMLYKLANQEGGFKPVKYFSIDRVFRNETVDATHLAEFHQVELFVADRNLTLGHLIGMIATFFQSIGITQIKFKPAYNPYTEPRYIC